MTSPNPAFVKMVNRSLTYWEERFNILHKSMHYVLHIEENNIFNIITIASTKWNTAEKANYLLLQIFHYIEFHGFIPKWVSLIEILLEKYPNISLKVKSSLLLRLGELHRTIGSYSKGIKTLHEAKNIAKEIGCSFIWGQIEWALALTYCYANQLDHAEEHLFQAQKVLEPLNTTEARRELAQVSNVWGIVHLEKNQLILARSNFDNALKAFVELSSESDAAIVLRNLGKLSALEKDFNSAHTYFEKAFTIFSNWRYALELIRLHISLGNLLITEGEYVQAKNQLLSIDQQYLRQAGHEFWLGATLTNLGYTHYLLKELSEAEAYLQEAIGVWKQLDNKLMIGNSFGNLSIVFDLAGKTLKGHELYLIARNILLDMIDVSEAREYLQEFDIHWQNKNKDSGKIYLPAIF